MVKPQLEKELQYLAYTVVGTEARVCARTGDWWPVPCWFTQYLNLLPLDFSLQLSDWPLLTELVRWAAEAVSAICESLCLGRAVWNSQGPSASQEQPAHNSSELLPKKLAALSCDKAGEQSAGQWPSNLFQTQTKGQLLLPHQSTPYIIPHPLTTKGEPYSWDQSFLI